MSFLDVIGDIGTVWNATDRANQARQDREYLLAQRQLAEEQAKIAAEMNKSKVEEYRRQQELEAQIRKTIGDGAMVADQPAREVNIPLPTQFDDQGESMPAATRTVAAVAGKPNRYDAFKSASRVAQSAGDWKRADELEQRAKLYKQEGLNELANDLMTGRDYVDAVRDFNSKGVFRINEDSLQFDPQTKAIRFTQEDGRGTEFNPRAFLGKMPKLSTVAEGAKVIDETGRVVVDNSRNREAEEKRSLERQKELARYKADLESKATKGDGKATAEIQNLTFIAQNRFGGDIAKAIDLKFASQDKSRTQIVRDMMQLVKDDYNLPTPQAKLQEAERLADALIGRETNTRGAVKRPTPPAQPKPNTPSQAGDYSNLWK